MARSPTRLLSLALAATLVASTGASVATAWAVSESLDRSGEVARREERTAYLVSAIALDVSRLRANLLEGVTEPDVSAEHRLELPRRLEASLEATRSQLPALLGPVETDVWQSIEPRLDTMLGRFDRVIAAIQAGEEELAESLLDDVAVDARLIADDLDRFREVSLGETAQAVAEIQTRGERTLRIASIAWLGLVAALAFVWVLILRLVGAQRRALAAKMQALEAANRELEAFSGRVAHDMRNVLSPIQLAVDAIDAATEDPGLRRIAQRVGRSCARGRDLVEGLLAFSRAGGESTSPQRADACKEVASVLDQLSESLHEADVRVTTRLPGTAAVAIGPALLHVVLLNVIGNAVKFMHGRQERRLSIRARRAGDRWTIEIADTGPGIPDEELPRVFDALYRGARSTGSGIGLGLATVKRIVESRGGGVTIASAVERGTTVTLELPEAAPIAERATTAPVSDSEAAARNEIGTESVGPCDAARTATS